MEKINLLGLSQYEFEEKVTNLGEKAFRGRQLYAQVYRRKQFDIAGMTDLAKAFRERLSGEFEIRLPVIEEKKVSIDGTVKYLFRLDDGEGVEAVYIPEEGRDTLCISSQAGCRVGCRFCMTAQMGFRRNLEPGEITGQVLAVIRDGSLREKGFNIVFMGMGEPLHNYDNVMKAFRLLTDPDGIDLSYRKITVSTSGVVPMIRRLAGEERPPSLAVSLNAADDETRDRIMPINREWNIKELLEACREYSRGDRRRITIEYVLLDGINDSDEDAGKLAMLLRGIPVKVNLISYNSNPGLPFQAPGRNRILRFQEILMGRGLSAFIRPSRGSDVAAASWQERVAAGRGLQVAGDC